MSVNLGWMKRHVNFIVIECDVACVAIGDEKQCIIRSFHSSVLQKKHSSNAARFIIPLAWCWTQKTFGQVWAATFCSALSGKRGLTRCELKRPSFGCLIYCKQAIDFEVVTICWLPLHQAGLYTLWPYYYYSFVAPKMWYIGVLCMLLLSTAIGLWKHRIPSDLRS